jgi:hypothetical protein
VDGEVVNEAIITLAGTGDTEVVEHIVKWWQPGSAFEQELLAYLDIDGEVHFEPFYWCGSNSERRRRRAARKLLRHLKQLELQGRPYHLIGHSHGGSIIAETMMMAARSKTSLENLRSVTSIGTPFIEFTYRRIATRNLMRGLGGTPWLLPIQVAVGTGLVLASDWKGLKALDATPEHFLKLPLIVLVGSLIGIILLGTPLDIIEVLFSKGRRYSTRTLARAKEQFGPRWQSLYHGDDEAVSALGAARHIGLRVFRNVRPSQGIHWLASVSLFVGIVGAVASGVAMIASLLWAAIVYGLLHHHGSVADDIQLIATVAFKISGGALLVFGSLWLLAQLARVTIDTLFEATIGRWLDRVVSTGIRKTSEGLDISDEQVRAILPQPEFTIDHWMPLPDPVKTEMTEFVNRGAVETLYKLRHILGVASVRSKDIDLIGACAGQLSWHELIHTTYFYNTRFVKLVAYGMCRMAGVAPDQKLRSDPEFADIEAWHGGIRGAAHGVVAEIASHLKPQAEVSSSA